MKLLKGKRKPKNDGVCSLCKKEDAATAGMCRACYQWWSKWSARSAREFSGYVRTAEFRAERTLVRLAVSAAAMRHSARKAVA